MARNDQYRMANLRRRLRELDECWRDIECSPSIFRHHGKSKSSEYARASAAMDLQGMFKAEDGFGKWSADVLDAFGLDPFPTYQPKPPSIVKSEDASISRQQLLTGFEDPIQSGLQIILWAAARKKPELVLPASAEWFHVDNLRIQVDKWAENLIIPRNGLYVADPKPMKWVQAAFDHLHESPREQSDPEDDSAYQLASKLWPGRFETYKQFRAFLRDNPTIRTKKPGKSRLLVHAGDFIRCYALRERHEFAQMDAPSENVHPAIKSKIEERMRSLGKKKQK
jgi:hypothetical protein